MPSKHIFSTKTAFIFQFWHELWAPYKREVFFCLLSRLAFKFSRQEIDNIFHQKYALAFHAKGRLRRLFLWNVKTYFLENGKKKENNFKLPSAV